MSTSQDVFATIGREQDISPLAAHRAVGRASGMRRVARWTPLWSGAVLAGIFRTMRPAGNRRSTYRA